MLPSVGRRDRTLAEYTRYGAAATAALSLRVGARRQPFVGFASASNAVAALTVERDLGDEPWPQPEPLRVRMAIHTGEADARR